MTQIEPRIERLHVENYRVLRDITFQDLSPLTVLTGPNGSGKSTVFDVFAFLREAFLFGLRGAWNARHRMAEIRSRGSSGPVVIEVQCRESGGASIQYRLEIDEREGRPVVARELLRRVDAQEGRGEPRTLLDFSDGRGSAYDESRRSSTTEELESADLLAVSTLGLLGRYPTINTLLRFVTSWRLYEIDTTDMRRDQSAEPSDRLHGSGFNAVNVIQHLQERDPGRLEELLRILRASVPQLDGIGTVETTDGRLLLQLQDLGFDKPVSSKFISDGTLRFLAYLLLFHGAEPSAVIGIEEPENQLHPRLLGVLVEAARTAAERSQVIMTTHSPYLADAVAPDELWVIYRGDDGFAQCRRASAIPKVTAMEDAGGLLGDLWMEGYFGVGDPLSGGTT